eukprot:TRINITY_DN5559_c0_g1_i3.p4 TRINITY_DN5559_c0_g1~~TRINITY_DN5559_c0_g1_i3.p4  ORF type:complete len:119 (-),score=57.67 TRINITY_DN5559_c0_g1_i3:536-844(-)
MLRSLVGSEMCIRDRLDHMQWQSEFEQLGTARKKAISEWKQRQQESREKEVEMQAAQAEENLKPSEDELRKKALEKRYRKNQAEKLHRWRADKAQQEADEQK